MSVKISELPAGSTLTGAETVAVVQDGVTKRTTIGTILADSVLKGGTSAGNLTAVTSAEPGAWVTCPTSLVITGPSSRLISVRATGTGQVSISGSNEWYDFLLAPVGSTVVLRLATGPAFNTAYTADIQIDNVTAKTFSVTTRAANPSELSPDTGFWWKAGSQSYESFDADLAEADDPIRSQWTNVSNRCHLQQSTLAQRPTLKTVGNKTYLEFSGTQRLVSDGLPAPAPDFRPPPYSSNTVSPYMALACRIVTTGSASFGRVMSLTTGTAADNADANGVGILWNTGAGNVISAFSNNGTTFGSLPNVLDAGWGVLEVWWVGTTVRLAWNGVEGTSAAAAIGFSAGVNPTTITLGGRASANDAGLKIDIMDAVYYPSSDATLRTGIRTYLTARAAL